MVLLTNGGQEEAHFDPFGDSVNLVARKVHGLHRMYLVRGNHFGHTQMVLLGNVCEVEACFVAFDDSISLSERSVHGLRRM